MNVCVSACVSMHMHVGAYRGQNRVSSPDSSASWSLQSLAKYRLQQPSSFDSKGNAIFLFTESESSLNHIIFCLLHGFPIFA